MWNFSVPLIALHKYAQKSWHYMDIYRKSITGKAAEFANKNINHIDGFLIQFMMKLIIKLIKLLFLNINK